jgi:hypothetical protein
MVVERAGRSAGAVAQCLQAVQCNSRLVLVVELDETDALKCKRAATAFS